jgi:hypothetical protein
MYRDATHAFLGILLLPVCAFSAWANPSTDTLGDSPTPAAVLVSRGLKKTGGIYVLSAESGLKSAEESLIRDHQDLARLRTRRDQAQDEVDRKRKLASSLDQQRKGLRAAPLPSNSPHPERGPQPPREGGPQPRFGGGPMPPFGGGLMPPNGGGPPPHGEPHHGGPMEADREREARASQLQKLQHQLLNALVQVAQDQILEEALSALTRRKSSEIQRRLRGLTASAEGLKKRYETLERDASVQKALGEIDISATPRPKLGPLSDYTVDLSKIASDPEWSRDALSRIASAELKLGLDLDVGTLVDLTETLHVDLGVLLWKVQSRQIDAEKRKKFIADSTAAEKRLETELTKSAAGSRERIGAQLKVEQSRLKHLRADEDDGERARRGLQSQMTLARDVLVRSVRLLRKSIDQRQRESASGPAEDANLAESDQTSKAQGPSPVSRKQRTYLEEMEKTIHSETIALVPDKTVLWISVSLNGTPAQRMILDPDEAMTRISARVAAELGIPKPGDEPTIGFVSANGTRREGAPARLRSIQVGSFAINDAECLILPDDYDAPSVLGASFLDHFACHVDSDGRTITLAKVDIKPVSPRTPTRPVTTPKAKESKR